MIRKFLMVALLALAPFRADAGYFTDIWYHAATPGFGYNLVHTEGFIFVTFFIYGADNKQTWYIAQLQLNGTGDAFVGDVSATTGTNFAAPWNTANSSETIVGTATFTPSSPYQGTFSFNVAGKGSSSVTIERQTLLAQDFRGQHAGAQGGEYTGCTDPNNNGTYQDYFNLTITQSSALQITLSYDYASGLTCTVSGTMIQNGLLYRIPSATYVCSDGTNTTAVVTELKWTSQGAEGLLNSANVGGGCAEFAYWSAVFLGSNPASASRAAASR